MLHARLALCVCACLPTFAKAEIVLDAPPPAPVAPVAAPVAAPAHKVAPARQAAVVHREVPAAELFAEPPPPRESAGPFSDCLKLKDGSERVGDCIGASAAGVSLRRRAFPRPLVFPWEQVARMDFNQTVPKAGVLEPHLVTFANGDALPGQVVELSDDRIVVATWFAGKVEAKTAAVRRLGVPEPKRMGPEEAQNAAMKAFQEARTPQERARAQARLEAANQVRWGNGKPAKPAPPPEKPAPGMRLVILANGDKIQCAKFSIHEGKAKVETATGPLEIPSVRIRSCAWADAGGKVPPLPGARTLHFNGPLGGNLLLRVEQIADGKVVGTSDAFGRLEIALDAVATIQ